MDYVIQHHGILGQRWGIRRFQNPDGSLTEAGKKRYAKAVERADGDIEKSQRMSNLYALSVSSAVDALSKKANGDKTYKYDKSFAEDIYAQAKRTEKNLEKSRKKLEKVPGFEYDPSLYYTKDNDIFTMVNSINAGQLFCERSKAARISEMSGKIAAGAAFTGLFTASASLAGPGWGALAAIEGAGTTASLATTVKKYKLNDKIDPKTLASLQTMYGKSSNSQKDAKEIAELEAHEKWEKSDDYKKQLDEIERKKYRKK